MTIESVAHGFRSGLRFLSLMMLGIGLVVGGLARRCGEGIAGAARLGLLLRSLSLVALATHHRRRPGLCV